MAWHEPKKDKGDELVSANEMFGVSEERCKEIQREFQHIKIDAKNMNDIAEMLDLPHSGENSFKAFLFGRLVEENQMAGMMSRFKDLLDR